MTPELFPKSNTKPQAEQTLSRTTYRQMKVQLESAWDTIRRYEQDRREKVAAMKEMLRMIEDFQRRVTKPPHLNATEGES